MAEYRALAQNTYKFVTETTFNVVGDIASPLAPMLGRAKIVKAGELFYQIPTPASYITAEHNRVVSMTNTDSNAYSTLYSDTEYIGKCIIDGKVYTGLLNGRYYLCKRIASKGSSLPADMWCCPGIAKYVIYEAATGTITAKQFSFAKVVVTEISSTSSNMYQCLILQLTKNSSDIILALEFEYPKYDITVNNGANGVQYSLDDGATFQDVPETLDLSQIEHVIVKNTSTRNIYIGATSGGEEIATIAAGETRVIVPEADGTVYVS